MNFTTTKRIAQAPGRIVTIATVAATLSCASQQSSVGPTPATPDATVVAFLSAVRDNNLGEMAQLWGSSRGLASDQMDSEVLEQRLTITRIYLVHEEYAIVDRPADAVVNVGSGEQVVWVRLRRRGCTPVVPFTLTRFGDRWLIRNIDIEAAGNPERRCADGP